MAQQQSVALTDNNGNEVNLLIAGITCGFACEANTQFGTVAGTELYYSDPSSNTIRKINVTSTPAQIETACTSANTQSGVDRVTYTSFDTAATLDSIDGVINRSRIVGMTYTSGTGTQGQLLYNDQSPLRGFTVTADLT